MNSLSSQAAEPFALGQFAARSKSAAWAKLHPVNAMLIVSLAIPEEFSFYIGSLRLTITRAILLLAAPALVQAYLQRRGPRPLLTDFLVVVACFWMFMAVTIVSDFAGALAHTGPEVLDFAVTYFAFCTWTKTSEQLFASLELFCQVMIFAALVSVFDSLTSHYFLHDLGAAITGYVKVRQQDYRMGLLRAAGPFEHPIHHGVMCGTAVVIAVALPIKRRLLCIVACSMGLLLSFSSAPLHAAVMGVGLMSYDRYFARYKNRWTIVVVGSGVLTAASFLISSSPISYISNKLTFDPGSAWARQFEWQCAGIVIAQSPWLGIPIGSWTEISRQMGTFESVDSLWLVLSLAYGIPGSVLVGASVIVAACTRTHPVPKAPESGLGAAPGKSAAPGKNGVSGKSAQKLATLLSILLILTIYLGFTVHYWASLWVFIAFMMGLRTSAGCVGKGVLPTGQFWRSLMERRIQCWSAPP
jgi:hypothetical protein